MVETIEQTAEEGSDSKQENAGPIYKPPAIVKRIEGLPAYTRAYSNTCSFLDESAANQFFKRKRR